MTQQKHNRLEELASRSVEKFPSDRDKAAKHLAQAINRDESLKSEALYRLARTLVNEMVRAGHFAKMRRSMPELAQRIRENLGGILESWNLRSGVVLATATRIDLQHEIDCMRGVVRGLHVRIEFFSRLIGMLNDDTQTVGSVISNEQAGELFATIEKGDVDG